MIRITGGHRPDKELHGKVEEVKKAQEKSEFKMAGLAVILTCLGFFVAIGGNFMWWLITEAPEDWTFWDVPCVVGIFSIVLVYVCAFGFLRLYR